MTPKELANKLQPVILDLIYDSIDWQMDELVMFSGWPVMYSGRLVMYSG